MPIKIDFISNVRDLLRGTKDVSDAFEDVADSLDDVVKDGDKAERELERSFRDVADASKDTGRDIGRNMDDGFDKAKQGADEFKDEANSTAKEAAASFDGSAESIGDAFQEVAANAFAGFGPIGAAAGIAAAAGIGLAAAGFETFGEAQEASEESAADWAQAYVEAGGKVLTSAVTTARALDIITDTEGRFKEAEENAKNWGVSVGTAVAAMAGETWALEAAQQSLIGRTAEAERQLASQEAQVDQNAGAAYDLADSVNTGRAAFEKLTGEMEAGSKRADVYSQYLTELAANTAGATTEVDEFGDTITTLPDGRKIYIDAETGQATEDVDKIDQKIYSVTSTERKVKFTVDDSAVRNWVPPKIAAVPIPSYFQNPTTRTWQ